MPPYDPNSKRPKLVPVDQDDAPVDAILGPDPASDRPPALTSVPLPTDAPADDLSTPAEPAPTDAGRPHLSVVPPEPGPRALAAVPSSGGRSGGPDLKKVVAAVVAVVTVIGVVTVLRRRT